MDAPPAEIAAWLGALVMTVGGTAAVTRFFGRGDKQDAALKQVDADWRAEVKQDLKRLIEGQTALASGHAVTEQKLAGYDARFTALEKRQDAQADAHREAIAAMRLELTPSKRRR